MNRIRLSEDSVHVWMSPVDRLPNDSSLAGSLSASERERAGRFHFDRDRIRFLRRREFLRGVLARYSGVAADRLRFGRNEYGKPYLCGPDSKERVLNFSTSHSDGLAVVCLAHSRPVGIDIESESGTALGQDAPSCVLTPGEADVVSRLSQTIPDVFLRFWTCKEALLKAIGTGLSVPPDEIEVAGIDGAEPRVHCIAEEYGPADEWHLRQFTPEPGYCGAIAVRGRPFEPLVRNWVAEDHRGQAACDEVSSRK